MSKFNSGDVFKIPHDREFGDDFFVVTRARPFMGSQILDAICEGAEDIQISINARDVIKVEAA
jgi:hypothetical protein